MRPSDQTLSILRLLSEALQDTWSPRPFLSFGRSVRDRITAALGILRGIQPNPDIVPHVLCYPDHPDASIRAAVLDLISRSMQQLEPARLRGFESLLRAIGDWRWSEVGAMTPDLPPHVLGVFSMHPNGYVREAAVKALAKSRPEAVPYLILRANDWVKEVWTPAVEAISRRLVHGDAKLWAALLPLVTRLQRRSRADQSWLLAEIERLLLQPASLPVLVQATLSTDRFAARAAFDIALKLPQAGRAEIIQKATISQDGVLRLKAAKTVRASPDFPNRGALLQRFARDKFAPIRLEVLYAHLEEPEPREAITQALLDRSGSVREAARFHYKRLPQPNDPREFYLNALSRLPLDTSPRSLAAVLRGVGETGRPEDYATIVRFATNLNEGIARAGGLAVISLRPASAIELLTHRNPSVARAATSTLLRAPYQADPDVLRAVIRNSPSAITRQLAARVLLGRHIHDCYPDLLDMMSGEDNGLRRLAEDRSYGEHGEVRSAATKEQVSALEAAIRRNQSLPPEIIERSRRMFGQSVSTA